MLNEFEIGKIIIVNKLSSDWNTESGLKSVRRKSWWMPITILTAKERSRGIRGVFGALEPRKGQMMMNQVMSRPMDLRRSPIRGSRLELYEMAVMSKV